ncbi:uncharacterized protein EDB93DRAFT_1172935 [Suillus bovinus]|uniref:uncharacterized protein n=1 Tax=Suillus bovinus TaxID=48563 RepID=UPI001B87438F|nr:uncharacterized protein EDB93DRAFT_1172935 [Suillus bovinus]KAG2134184.1 hypothetical protein EDB93DRAFT_1172935 [Suillus bovinus]
MRRSLLFASERHKYILLLALFFLCTVVLEVPFLLSFEPRATRYRLTIVNSAVTVGLYVIVFLLTFHCKSLLSYPEVSFPNNCLIFVSFYYCPRTCI